MSVTARRFSRVDACIADGIEAITNLYAELKDLPQNQTPENRDILERQKEEAINNIQAMRYFDR